MNSHRDIKYLQSWLLTFILMICLSLSVYACGTDHLSDHQRSDDLHHMAEQIDAGDDQTRGSREAESSPCTESIVRTVRGLALNDDLAPIKEARAQVCVILDDERWLCLSPSMSDDQGRWEVQLPQEATCLKRLAVRLVPPHGSQRSASYCVAKSLQDEVNIGSMQLPTTERGWVLLDDNDPRYNAHNLSEGERLLRHTHTGIVIAVVDEDFRAVLINEGALSTIREREDCLSQNNRFQYSLSLSPEGFARATRLIYFPVPELEDGEAINLYAVGGLYSELENGDVLEEGSIALLGTSIVKDGGLNTDIILPFFTWIGLRPD